MRMRFAWSDPEVLRSVVCLVMVLIVALVPVGCGSDGDDDVAGASDLIDQWIAGWNDNDADAIAAVFTEDGTFIYEGDLQNRWTGREEIRREAAALVSTVWDMESAGRSRSPMTERSGPHSSSVAARTTSSLRTSSRSRMV